MMQGRPPFIPYPPIERLGVIGDRRTAATVAADGTICWWCLPDYDSPPVFGALLDAERGGYFRLGPAAAVLGAAEICPRYRGADDPLGAARRRCRADRRDAVAGKRPAAGVPRPADDRAPTARHSRQRPVPRRRSAPGRISRRPPRQPPTGSRCDTGRGAAGGLVEPPACRSPADPRLIRRVRPRAPATKSGLCSASARRRRNGPSIGRATCWERRSSTGERWSEHLKFHGDRADRVKQSALLVHLLSYAPTGAPVAAPTASLPERIGGDRNFDYRYAWVRDASLSLSLLSELGFTGDDERYLDWLAQLPAGREHAAANRVPGRWRHRGAAAPARAISTAIANRARSSSAIRRSTCPKSARSGFSPIACGPMSSAAANGRKNTGG